MCPDFRRRRCQRCRRFDDEAGPISWRGLCRDCGLGAVETNVGAMMERSGPNFTRWRQSMAACVGGVLLDEPRAEG